MKTTFNKETPKKPTAEKWLKDFIFKNKFETEIKNRYIIYSLDGQWVFVQNFKYEQFWVYYPKAWKVFEDDYSMKYDDIQNLYKEVVLKAFNCEEFIPNYATLKPSWWC